MLVRERGRAVVELDLGCTGDGSRVGGSVVRRIYHHASGAVDRRGERRLLQVQALRCAGGGKRLVHPLLVRQRRHAAVSDEAAVLVRDGQHVRTVAAAGEIAIREEGCNAVEAHFHAYDAHDAPLRIPDGLAVRNGRGSRPSEVDRTAPVTQIVRAGLRVALGSAHGLVIECAPAFTLGCQGERGGPHTVEGDAQLSPDADGAGGQHEIGTVGNLHLGVRVADVQRRPIVRLSFCAVSQHEEHAVDFGAMRIGQKVLGSRLDYGDGQIGPGFDIRRRCLSRGQRLVNAGGRAFHHGIEVRPAEYHIVFQITRTARHALREQIVRVDLHLFEYLAAREHGSADDALDSQRDAERQNDESSKRHSSPSSRALLSGTHPQY